MERKTLILDPTLVLVLTGVWYVFLVFVMVKRYIAWYWGMLILSLGVAALSSATEAEYLQIIVDGPTTFLAVLSVYVMGCIFARTLKELGIAESIVKRAIELGGGRPFALSLIIFVVWVYLSTAMPGPTGVILVGTITLPVMMAMGIEPIYAAIFHGLGWTAACPLWFVYWPFYKSVTGVDALAQLNFLYLALIAYVVLGFAFITISFRRMKLPLRWASPEPVQEKQPKMMPAWTFVLPAIPVVLVLIFGVDPFLSFVIGIAVTVALALPVSGLAKKVRDIGSITERIFYGGGIDSVGLLLVFFVIGWTSSVGKIGSVAAVFNTALQPLAGAFASPLGPVLLIVFATILGPLTLYRGPGTPFGLGSFLIPALIALGSYPGVLWFAVINATLSTSNIADPTVAYTVWSAQMTGVSPIDIMKKTIVLGTVMCLAVVIIGTLMYAYPI